MIVKILAYPGIFQVPADFMASIRKSVDDRAHMLSDFIGEIESGLQDIIEQLTKAKVWTPCAREHNFSAAVNLAPLF